MSVKLGTVPTFKGASATKGQALKVLEEAAEVHGAWQEWYGAVSQNNCYVEIGAPREKEWLIAELTDVIQASCNMLAGLGVTDLEPYVQERRASNEARGREYDDWDYHSD